jgi:hypothetical protein
MSVATTEYNQVQIFTETDKPYGKTYGAWTANWWQWIYSLPSEFNPLLDLTGEHWKRGQPSSDVWFLVGIFGEVQKSFPLRKIEMESGRSILFPVLNCEANKLEFPEMTHDDLVKHVVDDVNTVVKKDCTVNGKRISPALIASDPKVFSLSIDKNNALGVKNTGLTDAAAYGYWIFLKPLPKGKYNISFEGSCEFGRLNSGAVYEVNVV